MNQPESYHLSFQGCYFLIGLVDVLDLSIFDQRFEAERLYIDEINKQYLILDLQSIQLNLLLQRFILSIQVLIFALKLSLTVLFQTGKFLINNIVQIAYHITQNWVLPSPSPEASSERSESLPVVQCLVGHLVGHKQYLWIQMLQILGLDIIIYNLSLIINELVQKINKVFRYWDMIIKVILLMKKSQLSQVKKTLDDDDDDDDVVR
ncbi:Hypothetical_protein [Hexamita inflata]|uniref:Hypothetical_protein n=1 Tax=Hexamita inflata TaxID=28002 RepID=A0AA86QYL1_9EUKA|nr:Hypothetical protein HINF_LOCUS14536 [Hexamita inflata]CAI9965692.1 Hypothetical protein HINF_LOCUS53337 [Hexamita inflata]